MTYAPATPSPAPARRRDQQKEQTRLDLALAAFELAQAEGLAQVRVPQIAAAVGVSTRTFNNYFPSKEAAIVWPTTLRGARMAADLAERPAGEPLAGALVEVVAGLYGPGGQEGLPEHWIDGFRAMVAAEPSLHGEYLKAQAAGEQQLAEARSPAAPGPRTATSNHCCWPGSSSRPSGPPCCTGSAASPARRWPTWSARPSAWPSTAWPAGCPRTGPTP